MHLTARRTRRMLVVVTSVVSMLLAFAAPALASDIDLDDVSTVCVEGEPTGLQYTAMVRSGDQSGESTLLVEYKPADLDDDAFSAIDTLQLDDSNGFTASGSASGLDFGSSDRVTVRVEVTESTNPKLVGDVSVLTVDVTSCGNGSNPDAFATFTVCGEDAPAALLGNDGDEPLTYTVRATTGELSFERTVNVEPDRSMYKRVPLEFTDESGPVDLEGRTVHLMVEQGDATELDHSFLVECEQEPAEPTATITDVCTEDGGVVQVTTDNPTDATVSYQVSVDGEVVDTLEVASGGGGTTSYAVGDGDHEVSVTADGEPVASTTVSIECEPTPSATVLPACFDTGMLEVELINPDPTGATFVVAIDGEAVESVEVTDGAVARTYDVSDGDHDVVITADGEVVFDDTVTIDCGQEVLSMSTELACTDDGGVFTATIGNPGPATTAQLLVDGELVADVDVAAGGTTELSTLLVDDGSYDVVVVSGGETLFDDSVEVDCTDVLGEQDSQDPAPDGPDVEGETLPATGASTTLWMLAALLLMFLGADLVLTQLRDRFAHARG